MRVKFLPNQRMSVKTKRLIIASTFAFTGLVVFLVTFGYLNTGARQEAEASASETIPIGSFIINMGIAPQTFANGLKPYGMIYDLTTNYNVPVKWVINSSKIKDGNDFWHNSVNYRGGAFIIPAIYINSNVTARINYWISQGVQGNYSISSMNLPVYTTITSFPMVIIDNLSGNYIIRYQNGESLSEGIQVVKN